MSDTGNEVVGGEAGEVKAVAEGGSQVQDLGELLAKFEPKEEGVEKAVKPVGEQPVGEKPGEVAVAPGVGKPEEKPVVPEATEDDLKDLPDFKGNDEIRKRFIVERVKARKALEVARTQAAPVASEKAGEKTGGDMRVARPAPEVTVDDDVKVFELRATAQRVLDGVKVEGWDDKKAERVLKLSEDVIDEMDNEGRALEVLKWAKAGGFGDMSAAVEQEIERQLPAILARGRVAEKVEVEARAKQEALKASVAQEFEKVQVKYPALKEITPGKESREVKFVQDWMRTNVGTPDQPGRRFQEMMDPGNIGALMEDAMLAFRAREYEATAAERDRLRRERDGFEQPLTGGGPGGAGADVKPGSPEELKQIFSKYGR